jgi:SAM-dependent methyltransferase
MKTNSAYIGSELELFSHASNWKNYYGRLIRPFLGGCVAEVGAGIGATTEFLCNGDQRIWVCLEPDMEMAAEIEQKIGAQSLPSCCDVAVGKLRDLPNDERFDSILYIDVLEHIQDDVDELKTAMDHLKPGGYLVVLSPAHQFLFTPFDKSIGHHRRYDRNTLGHAAPRSAKLIKLVYLDSFGLIASLGNKIFLQQAMPTLQQILFWDRFLVPVSTVLDRLLFFRLGKSILAVWQSPTDLPEK